MRNRKSDIEKYLRGELSAAEMHALEKEALNDPFLAEALEGVEQAGADNFLFDLHRIHRSVHKRSRRRKRKNNTIRMWGWTTGIAATVLLVAFSGFLVINIMKEQAARQQVMRELASLTPEGDKKDTLSILYPKEIPVSSVQKDLSAQQGAVPRRNGYTTSKPSIAATAPGVITQEPVAEKTEVSDTDDVRNDETTLLALEETLAETEDRELSSGQVAEKAGVRETEQPIAREDAARQRDAGKKARTRTAPAEAQTRAPMAAALRPDTVLVSGKVVSAEDGEALPGVNIVIKGTSKGTATDAEGNYQLAVPGDTRLQFAFIGFETKELDVPAQGALNVQLQADAMQLSEVVVTGYGASAGDPGSESTAFRFAEPDGGRNDFKDYLSQSLKYPAEAIKNKIEGKVTVRFTVEPDGQLTNFEVVKGIGYGCDEELIRLIRQGPSWKPSAQGDRAIRDQVKVRFRFELPR